MLEPVQRLAMARQRITIGASGVDAFSGTAANVLRKTNRKAESGVRLTGSNASIRAIRKRRQASALRSEGRGVLRAGILSAAGQGFEAASNLKRIG